MISEDRQNRFAHVIVEGIWDDDLVDYTDDDIALRVGKQVVAKFFKEEGVIDDTVRKKLLSLKRNVIEGSMEWDTLYNKYYEEEVRRHG